MHRGGFAVCQYHLSSAVIALCLCAFHLRADDFFMVCIFRYSSFSEFDVVFDGNDRYNGVE